MKRLSFTQIHIARSLGISQGTVSGWFNKGYVPQPRILSGLAELLGVDMHWLLTGKQTPTAIPVLRGKYGKSARRAAKWPKVIARIEPFTRNYAGTIVVDVEPHDPQPTILLHQAEDGYNDLIGIELGKVDELIAALAKARDFFQSGGPS